MLAGGKLGAASRLAITAFSSFAATRWARTGDCLKKDSTSEAKASAADSLPRRGATHSRWRPQSEYRNAEGRTRRLVLGRYGALTPEVARDLARKRLTEVAEGED